MLSPLPLLLNIRKFGYHVAWCFNHSLGDRKLRDKKTKIILKIQSLSSLKIHWLSATSHYFSVTFFKEIDVLFNPGGAHGTLQEFKLDSTNLVPLQHLRFDGSSLDII